MAGAPDGQGAAAARAGRSYEVRLVRPALVGDVKRLTLSFASLSELLVTGTRRPFENHQSAAVELIAVAEVLAVNDRGRPAKIRLTVERGSVSVKEGSKDELSRGQVLVAELSKANRVVVTREGAPLSEEAARLLVEALPYHNTLLADVADPAGLGSADRRRVGESWPLDNATLSDLIPRRILLDRAGLAGSITLAGAGKLRDEPCLKVRLRAQIPHYAPKDGAAGGVIPRGFKFVDGSLAADFEAFYPIDATRQPVRYAETIRVSCTAEPNDHKGQATAASHNTRSVEFADVR
jgi:hypothetical protein